MSDAPFLDLLKFCGDLVTPWVKNPTTFLPILSTDGWANLYLKQLLSTKDKIAIFPHLLSSSLSYQNASSYKPIAAGQTVEFPCSETGAKVGLSHNSSLFLECGADGQFPVVSEFCEVRRKRRESGMLEICVEQSTVKMVLNMKVVYLKFVFLDL